MLARPKITLVVAALVFLTAAWPLTRLGGEFLPPLDEGDLLYMPIGACRGCRRTRRPNCCSRPIA